MITITAGRSPPGGEDSFYQTQINMNERWRTEGMSVWPYKTKTFIQTAHAPRVPKAWGAVISCSAVVE